MSWIQTHGEAADCARLEPLFDRARDPRTGEVDHIIAIHSLHPEGMEAHLGLYEAVMRGTTSLPKVDRELIALVVSQQNACHY